MFSPLKMKLKMASAVCRCFFSLLGAVSSKYTVERERGEETRPLFDRQPQHSTAQHSTHSFLFLVTQHTMPPPPPPSKSYLLNITDSDLEESDDEESQNEPGMTQASQTAAAAVLATKQQFRREGNDEEQEDDDDSPSLNSDTITSDSPDAKPKKKRKKRKKKKKKAGAAPLSSPVQANAKTVSFGDVQTRSFARSFYSDGVPSDGGWPLGFSNEEPYHDAPDPVSVEDYEIDKQARLEERWYQVVDTDGGETAPPQELETRQWDYKFGTKNPLFRALSEKARMHTIMGISENTASSPSSSPSKKTASPTQGRRTRSNSDLGTRSSKGRTRSGSYSSSHSASLRSNSYTEDKDVDFEARHVMHELEQLRTSRSKRGAKGCTCRKLLVYIPPPGSGKKAAHRRMKVPKLKEELRARNALSSLSPNASREEMERLLIELVQNEPCCGPDCECVQNGIECQSDACTCWHAAAHHVKDGTTPLRPIQIEERCGNSFGMVTVDSDMIDAYRAPFLTCLPAEDTSE
jgi:hypothetical protein